MHKMKVITVCILASMVLLNTSRAVATITSPTTVETLTAMATQQALATWQPVELSNGLYVVTTSLFKGAPKALWCKAFSMVSSKTQNDKRRISVPKSRQNSRIYARNPLKFNTRKN